MTRLAFAIGILIGLAAGYWLARKRREPVKQDAFAEKMMQRTGDLNKKLAQHKQNRQDEKRAGRLSNGT